MIRLILLEAGVPDQEFEFEQLSISLGRAPSNRVTINDPRISGKHGEIVLRDDAYYYRDLLSTNGSIVEHEGERTLLDGRQHVEAVLRDGDLLHLGDLEDPISLQVEITHTPSVSTQASETILAKRSMASALPELSPEDATSLGAIFQLVKDLNSHLEVDEIYTRVADYLLAALPEASHVSVFSGDQEGFQVEFVRSRPGRDPREAPRSRSILGQVIARREAILFQDLEEGPLRGSESIVGAALRSAVCAPLLHEEQVLAILQIAAAGSDQTFANRALDLVALLAHQVGAILENALLFRQLQEAKERLSTQNVYLREQIEADAPAKLLVGESEPIKQIYKAIGLVADSDTSVLVLGETGTGKELVAMSVHQASARREGLFAAVNCGALSPNLLESELFGHVKGSFTGAVKDKKGMFEVADGGTLFLDEIGEMVPALQVKLLRALQEGEVQPVGAVRPKRVSVRVIAATNRDLTREVAAGNFRQDLYYRINVFPIHLPPLRERPSDIVLLCQHFLRVYATKMRKQITGLTTEALEHLRSYKWPGNVRELQNEIERAVLLAPDGGPIGLEELSEKLEEQEPEEVGELTEITGELLDDAGLTLKEVLTRYEEQVIRRALEENGWNRARTARMLGISRQAFMTKLGKLGIRRE